MIIPALLFAVTMWFVGTAAIVWLDSRPRATFATSLTLAGFAAMGACAVIRMTADGRGEGAAYAGFAAAIVVWGWHEMSFLMGVIAGPNRADCPPDARGGRRFWAATATVIHHELAIAATALVLAALVWGYANQTAPLTFALLFAFRLSAKFNLYFGVPNLSDEVFPEHLAYLKTYFRKARCNPLFPVSIVAGTAVAIWAWRAGSLAPPHSVRSASGQLLAGLAGLGVIEHLFLVLPLKDARLWQWAASWPQRAPARTPVSLQAGSQP